MSMVDEYPRSYDEPRQSLAKPIFGWFDSPEQENPAHDPGFDVLCPFCMCKLECPAVAISLMKDGDSKSYFYRAHKSCYDRATEEQRNEIDWSLIDAMERP